MQPDLSDPAAFGAFYADQRPRLERLAFGITRDHELARDVVANAAIRVWLRFQDDTPERPIGYLVRAVQNEARDQLRRRGRDRAVHQRYATDGVSSLDASVEDRDLLGALLSSLTEPQRMTLELRYLADLSDNEIALRLGVRPTTVRSIAHRALHRLRHQLPAALTPEAAQ